MKPKFSPLVVAVTGLAGCGRSETWVDTLSGTCVESQIEETMRKPELFVEMGTRICNQTGAGEFAGEFRCDCYEESGTRKLLVRCKR